MRYTMTENPQERELRATFAALDVPVCGPLAHVRLSEIDPTAPFAKGEHLEFDGLAALNETAVLFETTTRKPKNIHRKFKKFCAHFDFVRSRMGDNLWKKLGVPASDLRHFRAVKKLKAAFVAVSCERHDLTLSDVPDVITLSRSDWSVLKDYEEALGTYARPHILALFGESDPRDGKAIMIDSDDNELVRFAKRQVVNNGVVCDLFTFGISPYDLIPVARVHRRDELPSLDPHMAQAYQRLLIPKKLANIREKLKENPDFMFPNSILLVLSADATYTDTRLLLPAKYGIVEVVDGQHRLFSYAHEEVRSANEDPKILVTALHFQTNAPEEIRRQSARTFIEINGTQQRVASMHLNAIGYGVLGYTESRYLAAAAILRANDAPGGHALSGFFRTSQRRTGIVPASTVLTALSSLTKLDRLKRLAAPKRESEKMRLERAGFENLYGRKVAALTHPEDLVTGTSQVLRQFFNRAKTVYHKDWPMGDPLPKSSLQLAKMVAAFVRLLNQFLKDGLGWTEVQGELETIRKNVLAVQRRSRYRSVLFDPGHHKIPDARHREKQMFEFLNANRWTPTGVGR
jgi:hypothetical protein